MTQPPIHAALDLYLSPASQILEEHRAQGQEDQALEKRVEGKKAAAKKKAAKAKKCKLLSPLRAPIH